MPILSSALTAVSVAISPLMEWPAMTALEVIDMSRKMGVRNTGYLYAAV